MDNPAEEPGLSWNFPGCWEWDRILFRLKIPLGCGVTLGWKFQKFRCFPNFSFLCRSRLADFHANCQATFQSLTSCPGDNFQACLGSYAGLIGECREPRSGSAFPAGISPPFPPPHQASTSPPTTWTPAPPASPSRPGAPAKAAATRRRSARNSCGISRKIPVSVRRFPAPLLLFYHSHPY